MKRKLEWHPAAVGISSPLEQVEELTAVVCWLYNRKRTAAQSILPFICK